MIMTAQTIMLFGSFIQLLMFVVLIIGIVFSHKAHIETCLQKIPMILKLSPVALSADELMEFFGFTAVDKNTYRERIVKIISEHTNTGVPFND